MRFTDDYLARIHMGQHGENDHAHPYSKLITNLSDFYAALK